MCAPLPNLMVFLQYSNIRNQEKNTWILDSLLLALRAQENSRDTVPGVSEIPEIHARQLLESQKLSANMSIVMIDQEISFRKL